MAGARCKYFGQCGGCSSQHIDYSLQVENKRKQVAKASGLDDISVFTGAEYGYRTRMDFIFHSRGLGLRKVGSRHSVVDIERCEIVNEKVNLLLSELRGHFKSIDYFDLHKKTGTFRFAVIRAYGEETSVSFVLNEDSMKLGEAQELIREYALKSSAKNIQIAYVPANVDESISAESFAVKGDETLSETYLGKTFHYHVQGFFQNNHEMAEKMQRYCNELLQKYDTHDAYLLDLYGGVGTFGIMNAKLFRQVTTIESVAACTEAAILNAQANDALNVSAITLDAAKLRKLELAKPLFVITDPPRSGMHQKTIEQLKNLSPKAIIYVSCNIEQLSKDLSKFPAYRVGSTALFDLFPQTPHSEAIVELVR